MDILNWLRIKKQQLIRTTLDSPKDLVVLGADVSYQKRGDKYQSYAMPAEDFLATAARPYKVYTALLTQSGGDSPLGISSGAVTKGVTYTPFTDYPASPWDFSNVGGPIYPDTTPFVATSNDVPNNWGGTVTLGYNTGAPVVTVLENTIGNITWSYVNTGNYLATLTGAFPYDKTFITTPSQFTYLDSNGSGIGAQVSSADTINIYSLDANSSANGILNGTPIEIRVYN